MRVASSRCVDCDAWVVDAYYCYECAFRTGSNHQRFADERRPITFSKVSRNTQLRVDQGAAYEQMLQLQTVNDHGVLTIGDGGEAVRSRKVQRLRVASNPSLTHAERARVDEITATMPSTYSFEPSKRIRQQRRRELAAARAA